LETLCIMGPLRYVGELRVTLVDVLQVCHRCYTEAFGHLNRGPIEENEPVTVIARKTMLTDRFIKALKPAPLNKQGNPGRYIVWDAGQRYLGVSVTYNGAKSFIVIKRRPGFTNPYKQVLGSYPGLALKAAREQTRVMLNLLAEGKSPREANAEKAREEARKRADTFAVAVEKFIENEASRKLRTWRETEAILRRGFLGQKPKLTRRTDERGWVAEWIDEKKPVWRDRPIAEIARRDVIERLDEIKARAGKHAARHALAAVRRLFNWAADGERFGVEVSPAALIRDKTIGITNKDLQRKRVLTDPELRDVWRAAEATGYPFGPLVQILMLTGQRLTDINDAKGDEIGAGTLVVPPERFKSDMTHEIPLTPKVAEILSALPKFKQGYLFTTSGGSRPISGISKMKERLDRAINEERAKNGAAPMPHWVLHDLRRTLRTRLTSDLGVDAFIAERVIGHTLPGLHGVYDQGRHRTQKRDALARWEALLLSIVKLQASLPSIVRADEVERQRKRNRA
jgi:integrase